MKALASTKKISESDLVDFASAKAFVDDALAKVDVSNLNQLNAVRDVLFLWEDIAPWARLLEDDAGENVIESVLSSMWFNLLSNSGDLSFAKECIALASTTKLKKRKKQLVDDSKFALLSKSHAIELLNKSSRSSSASPVEASKFALLLPYDSVRKTWTISVDIMDRELALALVGVKSAFAEIVNASTKTNDEKFIVQLLRRLQDNPAALFYAVSLLANDFKQTAIAADALFSCLRIAEAFRNPDSAKIVLKTYLSQSNLKKFAGKKSSSFVDGFTATEMCSFESILKGLRERSHW